MPCKTIVNQPGSYAVACSRRTHGTRCSVHGCSGYESKRCDYPLSGSKAGKTCDRPLCAFHAQVWPWNAPIRPRLSDERRKWGEYGDACPTHYDMLRGEQRGQR